MSVINGKCPVSNSSLEAIAVNFVNRMSYATIRFVIMSLNRLLNATLSADGCFHSNNLLRAN